MTRRSTLGYDVGLSADGDVSFRVTSNSAPGAFARTWVSWREIKKRLEGPAREKAITSAHLARVYPGNSANSAGFLAAVLRQEGLLKPSSAKKRCHELVDDGAFLDSVETWDRAGKGTGTSAGAKARTKAGARFAKVAKGDPTTSVEGGSADVKSIPSLVAKDSPSTKPKGRTSAAAKKRSTKAARDATRKSTKKRR